MQSVAIIQNVCTVRKIAITIRWNLKNISAILQFNYPLHNEKNILFIQIFL